MAHCLTAAHVVLTVWKTLRFWKTTARPKDKVLTVPRLQTNKEPRQPDPIIYPISIIGHLLENVFPAILTSRVTDRSQSS